MANSADPVQTPQNATSDQGMHCLLKLQEVSYGLNETIVSPGSGPFSQPTLRDNRPTRAVSALIKDDWTPLFIHKNSSVLPRYYERTGRAKAITTA